MSQDAGSQEPGDAPKRRRSTAGRIVEHRRATEKALLQADESLRGVLTRAGETTQPDNGARSGRARRAMARGVKALPVAERLRRLAPAAPDLARLEQNRARVERALVNRARLLSQLRPGAGATAVKALSGGEQIRASHLATRYGAHMLVLGVLLLVLLSNAFPTFKARAGELDGEEIGDTLEYSEIDAWLEIKGEDDPANPVASYLSNPVLLHTAASERVETYNVVSGDTLQSVAGRFGLRLETIMAANGIVDPTTLLIPGTSLTVLPVDGAYHIVAEGESLEAVAQRYQVEPQAIAGFKANGLEPPYQLRPGQALVVPGGTAPPREEIIVHRVSAGETLAGVAQMFGLDEQSILDANPELAENGPLTPTLPLRILPVPGVAYTVQPGDTLASIAVLFDTDPQMIVDYAPNRLSGDADLRAGELIIVPGGYIVPPTPTPTITPTPLPTETPTATPEPERLEPVARGAEQPPAAKPAEQPAKAPASSGGAAWVGTGRFIWPVGGEITTYFSKKHNGIDIANKAGTAIRAADSGEVIHAGWRTDGLGYAVLINHHNGYVTVYGHMIRQPAVRVGQLVARGEVIGYMGSTGKSTGPHVHFIIRSPDRVYMNPLRFLGQ